MYRRCTNELTCLSISVSAVWTICRYHAKTEDSVCGIGGELRRGYGGNGNGMGTISIAVQQCRLYLHWGPGHPQPNGAPLLESIYQITLDYVRHSQYSNHVQHRGAHRISSRGGP